MQRSARKARTDPAVPDQPQHQKAVEAVAQVAQTENEKTIARAVPESQAETELRVRRECAAKYSKDTERHECDLADARRERDRAKALRNRAAAQRLESNRICLAKDTMIKNAQHQLAQNEARCTIIQDAQDRANLDLRREKEEHARTRQALGSLREQHRVVQRDVGRLQATVRQSIGSDLVKDNKIDELASQEAENTRLIKENVYLKARVQATEMKARPALSSEQCVDTATKKELDDLYERHIELFCEKMNWISHKARLDGDVKALKRQNSDLISRLQLRDDLIKRLVQDMQSLGTGVELLSERVQMLELEKKGLIGDLQQQKDITGGFAKALQTADTLLIHARSDLSAVRQELQRLEAESKQQHDLMIELRRRLSAKEEAKKRNTISTRSTQPQTSPKVAQTQSARPPSGTAPTAQTQVDPNETRSAQQPTALSEDMEVDPAPASSTPQPAMPPKPAYQQPFVEDDMEDAPPIAPSTTSASSNGTSDASSNPKPSASSNAPKSEKPPSAPSGSSASGSDAILEAPIAVVFPTKQQVQEFMKAKGDMDGRVHAPALAAHFEAAVDGRTPAWSSLLTDTVDFRGGYFSLKK